MFKKEKNLQSTEANTQPEGAGCQENNQFDARGVPPKALSAFDSLAGARQTGQDEIVNVRYFTAFPKCNYSCGYCIAGHGEAFSKRESAWKPERYQLIIENLTRLAFKINVRLGVDGEFFLDKTLMEGARRLSHSPNVVSLNLITNLSFSYSQYKRLLSGFREEKIAIVASFHPTEVKNHDAWFKTAALMAADYDFAALLVGYPPLLGQIPGYRAKLVTNKIETFVQPFIGSFAGKHYPRDYTAQERQLLREVMYSRHDVEFLLNAKKPGLCNAGFRSLFVDAEGGVFPCGMGPYPVALGNLADGPDLKLGSGPQACPFEACQCDTENINTVQFKQYYERESKNQHKYSYRFHNNALTDNSLDEWVIPY